MHPFCCVSPVSDRNRVSNPATLSPPPPTSSFSSQAAPRPNCISLPGTSRSAAEGIMKPSTKENCTNQLQLPSADAREVKINDIVGNGICGILYKWVNYGKGWRPRWFVLQDGVLSYYKIHGPDKIVTSKETVKGCKVIGEESFRRISKQKNTNCLHRRKPFGEIHLKVSTIKESRSDDKRFSIFTGTKRLYLRAESREDRAAWVDALQAVKDMFPRISNSELMTSVQVVVSTEKLRQRLQEEGVSESAIQESEQIMRNEFAALQDQLMLLKQKQWQLIDTLRHLETEKVDLENTVVDESQKQSKEHGASSSNSKQNKDSSKIIRIYHLIIRMLLLVIIVIFIT